VSRYFNLLRAISFPHSLPPGPENQSTHPYSSLPRSLQVQRFFDHVLRSLSHPAPPSASAVHICFSSINSSYSYRFSHRSRSQSHFWWPREQARRHPRLPLLPAQPPTSSGSRHPPAASGVARADPVLVPVGRALFRRKTPQSTRSASAAAVGAWRVACGTLQGNAIACSLLL